MGFKAVVGSRKVNANAEVEYGGALKALARGKNVESAFARSNSDFWLDVADGPLRWLGLQQDNFLKEVDSFKVIGGQSDYALID